MANTITNVLPKLMARGLLALRENAIMSRLVNRSYEDLAAQPGNVINVPLPSAISTRAITAANAMAANVDSSPGVALVTLDQWYEAPFHLSDNDMISESGDFRPMQASEAIKALVNEIDTYVIGKHTGFYTWGGAAGTTPFASDVTLAIGARTKLNQQLAPMDDRRVLLDPAAEGNALGVSNILQFDQRGDQGGIINGTIGRKLGMDWYMSQNVTTFTPGTGWATGFTLATGGATAGNATITIVNATAAGTVLVGDLFTLAGNATQYRVTAAATQSAAVNLALAIEPVLASTYASGAAATVIATAYVPNLVFHRDAFAFASRPLMDIEGLGNMMMSQADPISGIVLRLEVSRQYKQTTFSYDALWGANVVRGALGTKIFG